MSPKRKSPKKTQIGKQLNLFGELEPSKPEKLVSKPEPIKKSPAKKKKKKLELEDYFEIAADTGQLIKEPEFDGFYFQPLEMAELVDHVLKLSSVAELSHFEDFDVKTEALDYLDEMLDVTDFYEDLYDRLEALIERARKQKKDKLAQKALAVLKLVEKELPYEIYFGIGLFTALLDRNVNLGIELTKLYDSDLGQEMSQTMPGTGELDQQVSLAIVELEKKYPGLMEYLKGTMNVSDQIVDVSEVFADGLVLLGIFTDKQLIEGNQILREYLSENFGVEFPMEPFFSGIRQIDEQQLMEFQFFLNNMMEKFVSDELLETIYDRIDDILSQDIDEELFDLLDEFLDRFEDLEYFEILTLLSSIFVGELNDYYERKFGGGFPEDSNIFPLN